MRQRFPVRWKITLAVIVGCASVCYAATITGLLNDCDAVVIAKPTAFEDAGQATIITLSVQSWLSGGSGKTAQVLWDNAPSDVRKSARLGADSTAGIWFLKHLPDGRYSAVPVAGPMGDLRDLYYKTSPTEKRAAAFEYGPDTPLPEKIALELAGAAALETGDELPGPMWAAAYGLIGSPRVHEACAYLAQMPGSRQKATGLACLIAGNDPAGVVWLDRSLQTIPEPDLRGIVTGALLGWRNTDPASVASLGRVATAPEAPYRLVWGATKALSWIHTADTLPYLVRLLDNDDREVRIDAVHGLWAFANGVEIQQPGRTDSAAYLNPRPTRWSEKTRKFVLDWDAPEEQIQEYVAFWKNWWQTNHALVR